MNAGRQPCFAPTACHLTLRVRAGNSALGPSHPATVQPGSIVLIAFQLSPAGVQKLGRARGLKAQVGVRRAGGPGSARQLMLVPYSTSGTSPAQSVSQARSIGYTSGSKITR